ncbi:phage minor head protein [Immundisolibacter sp.]
MDILDQLQSELIGSGLNIIRMEAATKKAVVKLLNDLEKEITDQIASADVNGVTMTAYRRKRLEKLLADVQSVTKSAYRKAQATATSGMYDVVKAAAADTVDALNGMFGAKIATVSLNAAVLEKLVGETLIEAAPSKLWWERQPPDLMQRFSDQMRLGMAKGETVDQMIQRIRGVPARNGQLAKAGLMDVKRHQAAALVRTSMQTVANEARMTAYTQNRDLVKGLKWLATLDNRTTPICRELDGKTWAYTDDGDLEPVGHDLPFPGPTAHWNCRSTQIPWLKSWEELTADAGGDKELAKRLDDVPESTRASMNGQVPKSVTYNEWLKSIPEGEAKKALGTAANFRLWRDNKLEPSPDLAVNSSVNKGVLDLTSR